MNNAADMMPGLLVLVVGLALGGGLALLLWWRGQGEQAGLRAALAQAEARLATQAQAQMEADGLRLTTPMEWTTCLACRGALAVVLCPHCHAPYHRTQVSPRGVPLDCWAAVVASGRCWHCKGDLTAYQTEQHILSQANSTPAASPAPVPIATEDDFQIVK